MLKAGRTGRKERERGDFLSLLLPLDMLDGGDNGGERAGVLIRLGAGRSLWGGGGTQARDCTAVACHEKEPCSAEREGEGEAEREEKEREER